MQKMFLLYSFLDQAGEETEYTPLPTGPDSPAETITPSDEAVD